MPVNFRANLPYSPIACPLLLYVPLYIANSIAYLSSIRLMCLGRRFVHTSSRAEYEGTVCLIILIILLRNVMAQAVFLVMLTLSF